MTTKTVLSPLPGIFYRKPSPEDPVYKAEGEPCETGAVIGLVEVMKSFHEVKSDVDGTVVKFLVNDEEAVVAGQPLMEVEE
ncbi:MAG: acetyl-CoA carboxylase [Gammaproteobacteria bacterium]|nr:acetyl-CoA carboxylase [Gammaproteobacteria bacterium]MCY4226468.1 acetyl-CoA carboxylase [Gammaproteobacteria bacterium]MCY4312224.1 acetyl-CoA carboxylase [Gammaproteobacteria bacterium]